MEMVGTKCVIDFLFMNHFELTCICRFKDYPVPIHQGRHQANPSLKVQVIRLEVEPFPFKLIYKF